MRTSKILVMLCLMALATSSFGAYTAHIGGSAGDTIYVKGPVSAGPDNSPLHESYNLIDETIDGNPNPNYLGKYYRFIFYDGTLHIDPNGKVGFTEKIFGSGNSSTGVWGEQYGTINVEGYLTGAEIRPWKNECDMEINVWGDGRIDLSSILRVGYNEGGVCEAYVSIIGDGIIQTADIDFVGAGSYVDLQDNGELQVLSSNYSEADANADITAGNITGPVTVSTVGDYTSIKAPEPATIALLGLGGLLLRRKRS